MAIQPWKKALEEKERKKERLTLERAEKAERQKRFLPSAKRATKRAKARFRGRKLVKGASLARIERRIQTGGKKAIAKRAKGIRRLAMAAGVLSGAASGAGAGRPKGSYKYSIGGKPVSVFTWRKHMADRKRQLAQFQQQANQRLAQKGFGQEQIQRLRQQHIVQRVQQGKPVMESNVADQELAFREHLQRNTVSPRTQQILVALRRTQNKAKSDNVEHERRTHERNLVGRSMNMMQAHTNLNPIKLDFTGVTEDNILSSPSVFKENNEDNILRPRGRNILDTGPENTLRF